MAGKARVHELAKELGVTSKEVLARLSEQGEFVKSASSTVEAPVARRLRESLGGAKPAGDKAKADGNGAPAKKAAAKAPAPEKAPAPKPAAPAEPVPAPAEPEAPAAAAAPVAESAPAPTRPGPDSRPEARNARSQAGAAHAARRQQPVLLGAAGRAGHPTAAGTPTGRTATRRRSTTRCHAGQHAAPSSRRSTRPSAARRRPTSGCWWSWPRRRRSGGGGRPGGGGGGNYRTGGPGGGGPGGGGAPAGGGGYRGRPGGGGGRPGQRGGAAGAFGRPGGAPKRGRKSKRAKRAEYENMQAPVVGGVRLPHGNGETVRLARGASLSDFAEKIDANPAALVQALFNLGEMVTATQSVGDDTLELLGSEMNYKIQVVSPEDEDRELLESFDLSYGEDEGDESDLESRPPVVTVMGHVDHGKTRLLDTIRQANVREEEAGGITQHIGAYQVAVAFDGGERLITFIDTPGHEAFTAMRARGAKATDIAILVVAADDGVMPQTVEAINHAQAADVPIVVAVNKIDKEGADPSKIRGQLTEYGLVPEEFGGDTMFVDISAKQGTNIAALEEAVLLTADAALDLRANPDMEAQGVAIEAHLDRGRGPVATVLISRGTLRVGDSIVAGDAYGRVRRMVDEHGEDVEAALPSRPVQVIGFTSVPGAGDNLLVVDEDRIARQIADRRSARKRNAMAARSASGSASRIWTPR